MGIDEVPREVREISREILDEFRIACENGGESVEWLRDYEVLELRATGLIGGEDLEVYLPRPLIEDLANLDLAARKRVLEDLRQVPGRALAGNGRFWVLGEQGRASVLKERPFL